MSFKNMLAAGTNKFWAAIMPHFRGKINMKCLFFRDQMMSSSHPKLMFLMFGAAILIDSRYNRSGNKQEPPAAIKCDDRKLNKGNDGNGDTVSVSGLSYSSDELNWDEPNILDDEFDIRDVSISSDDEAERRDDIFRMHRKQLANLFEINLGAKDPNIIAAPTPVDANSLCSSTQSVNIREIQVFNIDSLTYESEYEECAGDAFSDDCDLSLNDRSNAYQYLRARNARARAAVNGRNNNDNNNRYPGWGIRNVHAQERARERGRNRYVNVVEEYTDSDYEDGNISLFSNYQSSSSNENVNQLLNRNNIAVLINNEENDGHAAVVINNIEDNIGNLADINNNIDGTVAIINNNGEFDGNEGAIAGIAAPINLNNFEEAAAIAATENEDEAGAFVVGTDTDTATATTSDAAAALNNAEACA